MSWFEKDLKRSTPVQVEAIFLSPMSSPIKGSLIDGFVEPVLQ